MVDSHSIQRTKPEGESASINLKIYKPKPIGLTFDQTNQDPVYNRHLEYKIQLRHI
jgi:hypothetical protein